MSNEIKALPKVPGLKKLKKLWRIFWDDNTLEIVTVVHDVNPKSTSWCEKGVISGYDDNEEQGILDKIVELELTYPEDWIRA